MTSEELDAIESRAVADSWGGVWRSDITALVTEVRRLRAAFDEAARLCYAHPSLADEIRGLAK